VFFNAAVAVTSSLKYIFIRHIFDSHFWEFVVSQKYEINLFSENFDFTQFCASALCNKLVFKNIEWNLRDDTALDCLNNILNKTRGNYEAARNEMIGAIVVTHYNQDKTYRVDDINFDVNPMCKC